jgi:hypothetical protein
MYICTYVYVVTVDGYPPTMLVSTFLLIRTNVPTYYRYVSTYIHSYLHTYIHTYLYAHTYVGTYVCTYQYVCT